MVDKFVVTLKRVDENGKIISTKDISSKEILPPTCAAEFGYNQEEELSIMKDLSQGILDEQSTFLK